MREVELPEVGVGLLEVRDRRDDAGLQALDGEHVLDAGTHGVAGETLCIGDHDLVRRRPEDGTQRGDLGRSTSTAGGRVRLVGDEEGLRRHLFPVETPAPLGLQDQLLHLAADVLDVEARPVKCTVGRDAGHQFCDRADAALLCRVGRFEDEGDGPHADDHPVPTQVERRGGVLHLGIGSRRARGEET